MREGFEHCKKPNPELIQMMKNYHMENCPAESIELMQLMDLSFRFRKIRQRIGSKLSQRISHGEFFLLMATQSYQMIEKKGITVTALAKLMQVSPPAISRMLRGMEERNLVVRTVDESNRRVTFVNVTQVGKGILQESEDEMNDVSRNVVHDMGEENMTKLIELLALASEAMNKFI